LAATFEGGYEKNGERFDKRGVMGASQMSHLENVIKIMTIVIGSTGDGGFHRLHPASGFFREFSKSVFIDMLETTMKTTSCWFQRLLSFCTNLSQI